MKKLIIYPFFIVFLTSCSIQKSVIIDAPNLCNFIYEKEKNIKIVSNNYSLQVQGNYAFNKCFGAGLNIYGNPVDIFSESELNLKGFYGADASLTFYKYLNKVVYFELQNGYGMCYNNSLSYLIDGLEYGTKTEYVSNTTYQKIFLQPEFSFILERMKVSRISTALKFSGLYFYDYYFSYNSRNNTEELSDIKTQGTVAFNNKASMLLEYINECKVGDCFFIQFVTSFPLYNIRNETNYYQTGGGQITDKSISFSNPCVWPFKVFIGFDIKLGKDKKLLNF